MGSEHPATKRANNYACVGGQPHFSRTLLKQTRQWLKKREREREQRATGGEQSNGSKETA